MLRIRPIHFTAHPEAFFPILEALGMVRLPSQELPRQELPSQQDTTDWTEFDAGSGRLALHRVEKGDALDGVTKLGFEVKDVPEFLRRTQAELPAGDSIRAGSEDFGEFALLTAADGVVLQADATHQLDPTPGTDAKLSVSQMWLTPEVAAGTRTLQAMGAHLASESNSGEFAELTAKNGGRMMVHTSSLAAPGGLCFSYAGPTDALLQKLTAAGVQAHIVDESYGRTLHIENPDELRVSNTPTGPTIWVDEDYAKDNYGYTVHQ